MLYQRHESESTERNVLLRSTRDLRYNRARMKYKCCKLLPSLLRELKPSVLPALHIRIKLILSWTKPSSSANSDVCLPLTLPFLLTCSIQWLRKHGSNNTGIVSFCKVFPKTESVHMTQQMHWRASIIMSSACGNCMLWCRSCIEKALTLSHCRLLALLMPFTHADFPIQRSTIAKDNLSHAFLLVFYANHLTVHCSQDAIAPSLHPFRCSGKPPCPTSFHQLLSLLQQWRTRYRFPGKLHRLRGSNCSTRCS